MPWLKMVVSCDCRALFPCGRNFVMCGLIKCCGLLSWMFSCGCDYVICELIKCCLVISNILWLVGCLVKVLLNFWQYFVIASSGGVVWCTALVPGGLVLLVLAVACWQQSTSHGILPFPVVALRWCLTDCHLQHWWRTVQHINMWLSMWYELWYWYVIVILA